MDDELVHIMRQAFGSIQKEDLTPAAVNIAINDVWLKTGQLLDQHLLLHREKAYSAWGTLLQAFVTKQLVPQAAIGVVERALEDAVDQQYRSGANKKQRVAEGSTSSAAQPATNAFEVMLRAILRAHLKFTSTARPVPHPTPSRIRPSCLNQIITQEHPAGPIQKLGGAAHGRRWSSLHPVHDTGTEREPPCSGKEQNFIGFSFHISL
jgi:hypothetical protein